MLAKVILFFWFGLDDDPGLFPDADDGEKDGVEEEEDGVKEGDDMPEEGLASLL